ncbi:hypothetical protein [Rhodopirellula sp. P2]|uniref:hypothetical protein n=1 Tax=Rhodopirellula sp. P2 TaxID=2127060 RepID=UPI0023678D07|nr:hypothetical protein [Rhodopirellula sp. P2]WDQ16493.1 hypothetical protein PSR62_23145 [Rhodopirellula sp. P2]
MAVPQLALLNTVSAQGVLETAPTSVEDLAIEFVLGGEDACVRRAVMIHSKTWQIDRLLSGSKDSEFSILDCRSDRMRFWSSSCSPQNLENERARFCVERFDFPGRVCRRFGSGTARDSLEIGEVGKISLPQRGPRFDPYFACLAPFFDLSGSEIVDENYGVLVLISNSTLLGEGVSSDGHKFGIWHVGERKATSVELVFAKSNPVRPVRCIWRTANRQTTFANSRDERIFSLSEVEWSSDKINGVHVPQRLVVQAFDLRQNVESEASLLMDWGSLADFPLDGSSRSIEDLETLDKPWRMYFDDRLNSQWDLSHDEIAKSMGDKIKMIRSKE